MYSSLKGQPRHFQKIHFSDVTIATPIDRPPPPQCTCRLPHLDRPPHKRPLSFPSSPSYHPPPSSSLLRSTVVLLHPTALYLDLLRSLPHRQKFLHVFEHVFDSACALAWRSVLLRNHYPPGWTVKFISSTCRSWSRYLRPRLDSQADTSELCLRAPVSDGPGCGAP